MTTHQHQAASDASPPSPPPWPSAGPPTAAAATADSATTAGGSSTVTLAGALVIFVAISIGLLSLHYCVDAWGGQRQTNGAWSRRRHRRRRGDGTAGSDGGVRTRGVDPDLLRALPVTVYRAGAGAAAPGSKEEDAVECAVCLAELQDGEEARFLPRCGHGFHAQCVDMWLASHTTCPLCRLTFVVDPEPPSSSPTPTPASALRPLPPEPPNLLLGVGFDQGAVTAADMATDYGHDTAALAIEIPELAAVLAPAPAPSDAAAKSPVVARPRSFRRMWSFGRQGGPSSSSSCACACGGAGEVADVEQGSSVTIGVAVAVAEAQLPSEATPGAAPRRNHGDPDVRSVEFWPPYFL